MTFFHDVHIIILYYILILQRLDNVFFLVLIFFLELNKAFSVIRVSICVKQPV